MDVQDIKVTISGTDTTAPAYASALKRANDYGKQVTSAITQPVNSATSQINQLGAAASESFRRSEMSARELSMAARQLPMQFTDIVVSLQAGQPVMQVLLQQGGQLKDMYGGVGKAFFAMSEYIVSLINPYSLATAAAAGLFAIMQRSTAITDDFNKTVISTGNSLVTTGNGLLNVATYAGQVTNQYGLAREASIALANANIFTLKQIETATIGAVAAARLLGVDVEKTTQMMISLGQDPVKGIIDLDKQFNILHGSTLQQITYLQSIGKEGQAVDLALKAMTDTMRSRGDEFGEKLGWWGSLMKYFSEWSSNAGKNLEKIGNKISPSTDPLQELIDKRSRITQGYEFIPNPLQRSAILADLDRQISTAQKLAKEAQAYVREQGRIKDNERDLIESGSLRSVQVQNLVTEYRKIAELQQLGKISKSDADILLADTQNKLKALYENKEKPKKDTVKEELAQLASLNALIAQGTAVEDARTISRMKAQGATEGQIKQYMAYEAAINLAVQKEKDLADAKKLAEQISQQQIEANTQYISSIIDQVNAADLELQNYGKLPSAITSATLADLERAKALSFSIGLTEQNVVLIQQQIDLYKRLYDSQLGTEALKAADELKKKNKQEADEREKLAKRAQEELKRQYDESSRYLSRSITDGLMRGFENGKSIAENFKDTLINMFKTLVLEPVIRMVINGSGITGLVSGATSFLSGTANAAGSPGASFAPNGSILDQGMAIVKGITGGFDSMNATFTNGIEQLGAWIANGEGGILDQIGGAMGQYSAQISQVLGIAGSAYAAINYLSNGNYAGAALTAGGYALGGPVGGAIGAAIGSLFGGKVSTKKYSTGVTGLYSDGVFTSSNQSGLAGYGRALGANDALASVLKDYSLIVNGLFDAYGMAGDVNTSASLFQRSSKKTRAWGYFGASAGGGSVSFSSGDVAFGSAQDAMAALVEKILTQGITGLVGSSNLPEGIRALFANLSDKTSVQAMVQSAMAIGNAQDALISRYGLTADAAGKVALASGYAGEQLAGFAASLAQTALSTQKTSISMLKERDYLKELMDGSLPASLKDFDARLKGIDTSTLQGQIDFADMFAQRDRFAQFTTSWDAVANNLNSSLYGMLSPSEQLLRDTQALNAMYEELGISIPNTTADLMKLGEDALAAIKAGNPTEQLYDLALAFPTLVEAFKKTQEGILSTSQLSTDYFSTRADYLSSQDASAAGDSPLQYIKNQAQMNAELYAQLKEMQQSNADMKAYLVTLSENTAKFEKTLDYWDKYGMPGTREETA